mgnify:CR=1 FL=1
MCGIAGIVSLTDLETGRLSLMEKALPLLHRRGPDANGIYHAPHLVLGHTRLAILDTSTSGAQPMSDPEGRFTIVFNGEFFNYREHRDELIRRGVHLQSTSDTEVILHWYKLEGAKCLERINGFFALAIYDAEEKTLFVARDRMGVKPLFYYYDEKQFCFASEMKALMAMGIPKEIDRSSLATYLQLNYIPSPHTIFKSVCKLETGHYLNINQIGSTAEISKVCYYELEKEIKEQPKINSYEAAKKEFRQLMTDAVNRRMIADVPLGAFLSGGIDSSVVTGIAAKQTDRLKTFSIGFKDEPMFDETGFALSVSKKHKTEHTVFNVSNDDLFNIVFEVLDYLDEPFGDSSALNVYLLSRETKKKVTVALSGDGADELFGGYNKHMAEWRIRNRGWIESLLITSQPLWQWLPQSA